MPSAEDGRLAEVILDFARTLRGAGIPLGSGQVLDAIAAASAAGLESREDFYWSLHAVLVNGPEQRELFAQAFYIFFRNPRLLERIMSMLLPPLASPEPTSARDLPLRRLAEVLSAPSHPAACETEEAEAGRDAALTYSATEVLQGKDFEQMSLEELAQARTLLERALFVFDEVPTRRQHARVNGARVDLRTTMRRSLRDAGQSIRIYRTSPRRRHPPLVLICDISGSMTRYSRMFLHFAHSITSARDRVHTFVFGTRLTNITRKLRDRDVDRAIEEVADEVEDWAGGTRIGDCIHEFNRAWSRRVLAQGAVVLLVSDGLDRGSGERLAREMERLQKSCRRLVWLNPLLRYEDFEPHARGIRSMLPFVDEFRPAHNVDSLSELAGALLSAQRARHSRPGGRSHADEAMPQSRRPRRDCGQGTDAMTLRSPT